MERKEVMNILKKYCPENVVEHCLVVNKAAMRIAKKIKENGYDIDLNLVETGSLLHDIGRIKTHGIRHSYEGGKILKEIGFPDKVIRIVEVHIGAGIPKEEAVLLGLPEKDFIPKTIEEKIVCYADKLAQGNKIIKDIKLELKKLEKKLGKNHPAIKRLITLEKEIKMMLNVKR